MRDRRGFTLLELCVSLFVAAAAILVTMILASAMTGQMRTQGQSINAQDNARVAIDEIIRTLRGAGSGIDYTSGQTRFVYAGPYTVAFNANQLPLDDPAGTAVPTAVDVALADASVPLDDGTSYTPPRTFATGAETVVLTFDSNRDGALTSADAADDPEEASANPNDFVLKSFAYGRNGTSNTHTTSGLALLRGPGGSGQAVEPLFRYWIDSDNDPNTAAVLHGDANGDGALSATEAAGVAAVSSSELAYIERIEVTATAEPERPHDGSVYPRTTLRSTVSFRNRVGTAAHIAGRVFLDTDRDGVLDTGELGIRDVVIRCSNNMRAKTDPQGHYTLVLSPGIYTVTEVDPGGYESTTPNQVQVNPGPGDYAQVNFGDRSTLGIGVIRGTVFSDADADGERDGDEAGIRGVKLYLDTGATVYTNTLGNYSFTVQTKDYTVTEEDSTGYSSTTPNVVGANVSADGDTVEVNFGDHIVTNAGTIHGIVFNDTDNDGTRDTGETGVANVMVLLDGTMRTSTDSQGAFSFTAAAGTHDVTEIDSPGYTSSTVNTVTVTVVAHQTVEIVFGDIPQQDVSFQEITLGNTERALSIASLETGEDNRTDMDLALGTHYVGGRNDLLVWWNNRTNSSTPNSAIFNTTASFQRVISADVNAIAVRDLSGDGRDDAITALGTSSNNVAVWITQSSGSTKGQLPTSPTALYTASGATSVADVHVGTFDTDTRPDLVIGTETAAYTGKLEILHGTGSSGFNKGTADVLFTVPGSSSNWGSIWCLATTDFNHDGKTDIVVGARTSTSLSKVYVLLYGPGQVTGCDFYLASTLTVSGQINEVLAVDMMDDGNNNIDLVLGIETASAAGRLELWLNRGDNTFGMGTTANTTPDDTADPGGSPLSMVAVALDNDVFPDLAVGTRIGPYSGKVLAYRCYGYLPSSPQVASASDVGEVITTTTADYNKDGAPDVAVGTRTSSTAGKVVIYFNQRSAL
jgi:type II secretory pathway pseudopilin PulG